jgi:hypothetical protein
MLYFQTKNPNLGKFWRAFQRNMLAYFTAIGSIIKLLYIFYISLVYFLALWYILWSFGIFPRFGTLYQGKSGNPAQEMEARLK